MRICEAMEGGKLASLRIGGKCYSSVSQKRKPFVFGWKHTEAVLELEQPSVDPSTGGVMDLGTDDAYLLPIGMSFHGTAR